ncbi:TraV family lipoprotein [Achromobacter ruhlandii]|uniref:TraV family lipoprotein n=2 Tax=Alcaligenaceae TaxID=506 RepID=UPI0009EE431D|nr:TraV family lipoprotein [Achromobacter ruhlandii]
MDPNNPDSLQDGITCKTPMAVIKSTDQPMPLRESDLPFGVTMKDIESGAVAGNVQIGSFPAAKSERQGAQGAPIAGSYDLAKAVGAGAGGVDGGDIYGKPVREPAVVMRIWVAPWIDARDDLHYPSYVFTEVQPRRWAMGAAGFVNRGILAPAKMVRPTGSKPVGSPRVPRSEGSQGATDSSATSTRDNTIKDMGGMPQITNP